ncbi:MAG: hypothetical protein JXA61_07980 [Bacteroidales bacterium]|nr:hypothetical protein [Bacteroidales bacterium]
MSIVYLKHGDIDTGKWNRCIKRSFNATIYAYSWYLDLFCERWDALVENDYHSVMPLMTKRVLGRDIICTSGSVRELGVFSRHPVSAEKTMEFLKSIPARFCCYSIRLNRYNPLVDTSLKTRSHTHYVLDLIIPYFRITQSFTPGLRVKIYRSVARKLSFVRGLTPNDLILFLLKHRIPVDRVVGAGNFAVLRSMMASLIRTRTGDFYGVYNEHNDLAAVAVLAMVNSRIITLFLAADPEQIDENPHLFMIDRIIEKFSETNTTLSFEFFSSHFTPEVYLSFGARKTTVTEVRSGRMPFWVRPFIRQDF